MDLDSALLRAFVVTADERHFGRAAGRLFITQQALSKRIQRLESTLAVRLLDRGNRRVDLTDVGGRFLPYARQVVDALDAATNVVQVGTRPLRVDVLDERLAPLRLLHEAIEQDRGLQVDVITRDDNWDLIPALRTGDVDVSFGWAGAVEPPWPQDIRRLLVQLERVRLLVGAEHPLAATGEPVSMADLIGLPLWFPAVNAPAEWIAYLTELAADFELSIDFTGSTMGFEHWVGRVGSGERVSFYGSAMPAPLDPRVRVVPIIDPSPVVAWWVMWRRRVPDARVQRLVASMTAELPAALSDFEQHPDRVWAPGRERDCLRIEAGLRHGPSGGR